MVFRIDRCMQTGEGLAREGRGLILEAFLRQFLSPKQICRSQGSLIKNRPHLVTETHYVDLPETHHQIKLEARLTQIPHSYWTQFLYPSFRRYARKWDCFWSCIIYAPPNTERHVLFYLKDQPFREDIRDLDHSKMLTL